MIRNFKNTLIFLFLPVDVTMTRKTLKSVTLIISFFILSLSINKANSQPLTEEGKNIKQLDQIEFSSTIESIRPVFY